MAIDLRKRYFMSSYRYDKTKPEDFGLKYLHDDSSFIDESDNSLWEKSDLYDLGWGNEIGFVRLPKLKFDELWNLLVNSEVQENRYGAAFLIERDFPAELLSKGMEVVHYPKAQITNKLREALKILKLSEARNRGETIGKSLSQINSEYESWKLLSEKVKFILIN